MSTPMIQVTIGNKQVEVSAKELLHSEAKRKLVTVEPGVLAALAVLIEAAAAVAADVDQDINNPLTLLLQGKEQAQDVAALIADLQTFLSSFGVKF